MDIIELKEGILENNEKDAQRFREELKDKNIFLMNVMSAPGSGKTTTMLALNRHFNEKIKWGVMEADIDSDVDALILESAGIPSIQLHTGGMCHLDANMVRQGIRAFNRDYLDCIVLENIGNLVCPAEFDTGAALNLTILSVPEGDDKPAKYPLMYQECSVLVVNKIDALPVFDFNKNKMESYAKSINPDIKIFYISARNGDGVKELADYLLDVIEDYRRGDLRSWEK